MRSELMTLNPPEHEPYATDRANVAAVELNEVSKLYGEGKGAISNLSLRVESGDLAVLLGPNGAGKSTALKIIAGLTTPTSGRVNVFGAGVTTAIANTESHVGYVAQHVSVEKTASVEENMRFQASLYKLSRSERTLRIETLMQTFELTGHRHKTAMALSGGLQRRLDIAMALLHGPRLLILDEPSINLDPDSRGQLWRYLEKLRADFGTTILFSTHYLDEAERHAHHVYFIDKGRLVAQGTPEEVKGLIRGETVVLSCKNTIQANQAYRLVEQRFANLGVVVYQAEVHISVQDGSRAIPALMELLTADGVTIDKIAVNKPSLDDVYLYLTGARFAEVDSASAGERQPTFKGPF